MLQAVSLLYAEQFIFLRLGGKMEIKELIQMALGIISGYALWFAYIKYDLWKMDKKEKELDKLLWGICGKTPTGNKGTK